VELVRSLVMYYELNLKYHHFVCLSVCSLLVIFLYFAEVRRVFDHRLHQHKIWTTRGTLVVKGACKLTFSFEEHRPSPCHCLVQA